MSIDSLEHSFDATLWTHSILLKTPRNKPILWLRIQDVHPVSETRFSKNNSINLNIDLYPAYQGFRSKVSRDKSNLNTKKNSAIWFVVQFQHCNKWVTQITCAQMQALRVGTDATHAIDGKLKRACRSLLTEDGNRRIKKSMTRVSRQGVNELTAAQPIAKINHNGRHHACIFQF